MTRIPSRRLAATGLAIVSVLCLSLADVAAKPGGGKSMGSRGTRTQSAPPTTNTAPRQSQPLPSQPSTQTPGVTSPSPAATAAPRPAAPAAAAAANAAKPGSRWGGFLGGLGAGLLGAGLIGMLTGSGFLGGIGSFMGFLGMLLQIGLIVGLVVLAVRFFRRGSAQPAVAGMAPGNGAAMREAMQPDWTPRGAAAAAPAAAPSQELALEGPDFDAFERLLGEIQLAYGRGDRNALARRATPEMVEGFGADLDDLARRGLANTITDITLLQGDLAEAWREAGAEYATVAMRFSLIDVTIEKASGRVVEGDAKVAQEAIENWTFVRAPGEDAKGWKLAAIQPMG